jgi:light-regulated signal transduction histidine kinase (bacteriophytochrome)
VRASKRSRTPNDTQAVIALLQDELAATNREVMILTLELEQRVANRTAQLAAANQQLLIEVAERKRAEEEVKKLNEDLRQRAALLEAANEELESFSYSVSHDLRKPLQHISGFAEMLREEEGPALSETGLQRLDKIRAAVRNMAVLINELLRFSRLSRTPLTVSEIDLNEMVRQIIADIEPDVQGRRVLWGLVALPKISGDPVLLRQAFINLISNAVKYSARSDPAEITIGILEDKPDAWVFFIRDNGVGFDPQYSDKLFGVFQRLHAQDEFEGVGIGLANVRRIINRHGGNVWAEGRPGEGATFYFSLPK